MAFQRRVKPYRVFFFLSDIHGTGLFTSQVLLLANGFYRDENVATRAFSCVSSNTCKRSLRMRTVSLMQL